MKITFLGKDPQSQDDECPSLYDTDRDTYLVQGWRVPGITPVAGQACVEVPRAVMGHLAKSSQLTTPTTGQAAPMVSLTGHGTYLIHGQAVTDAEALEPLDVPAHEDVVEVPLTLRDVMRQEYAGASDT
ncbi:hypothetical protein GCM10017673_50330 [Streptosporangium violaceochromogenes]|nr:hypothetical protein GCM10017673_50330 [Streptosporangium violaceochromogenes]